MDSSTSSPITQEHVDEWASYGQKVYAKPTTPEEIETMKVRKQKIKDMKKRLAVEFNDKVKWFERQIERELNRLVLERQEEKQQRRAWRVGGRSAAHANVALSNRGPKIIILRVVSCVQQREHAHILAIALFVRSSHRGQNGQTGQIENITCFLLVES